MRRAVKKRIDLAVKEAMQDYDPFKGIIAGEQFWKELNKAIEEKAKNYVIISKIPIKDKQILKRLKRK